MVLKELTFLTIYNLAPMQQCSLKELNFNSTLLLENPGGLERTDFLNNLSIWEAVVVLKELIFNSF